MADGTGLTKADAAKSVDSVFDTITGSLKSGGEVRLVGFGTFSVADRRASEGRNPRTGEKIQIPASKQPKFKAGKGLEGCGEQIGLLVYTRSATSAGCKYAAGTFHFRATAGIVVRRPLKDWRAGEWAISSAGRAPRLHRGGRQFDPVIAHHSPPLTWRGNSFPSLRVWRAKP